MALYRSIGAALEDDNSGTNPIDVRKDLGGLFIRAGVLPGGTTPLVTGTAGWAYNLGAASWVTQTATGDGYHLWGNDGAVTVGTSGVGGTVPAAPGSGLSRIDILWIRHPSNGENGDTTSAPAAGVTCGTATSSPTAPAIPAGAFELARNTMTSAATTTVSTGNTITQTAAVALLVATETVAAELDYAVTVTAAALTSSTLIANRGVTDAAAGYDRVVEFWGIVNTSGLSAGAVWAATVTSTGVVVTANVVASARFPFTSSVAVGGSVCVGGSFGLAAGATCLPRLWAEELIGTGTLTVTDGTFKYRIRPAGRTAA